MRANWKNKFEDFLKDVLEITMPNRAFTSCVAFAAGMVLSNNFDISLVLGGISMILCTYSSQAVYNNIKDVDGDRVNAPDRPLARGSLTIRFAWMLMIMLIVAGFVAAYITSPFLMIVNIIYIFIGIIYSKYTKSKWFLSYATLVTSHMMVPLVSGYLVFGNFDIKILAIASFVFITEVFAFSLKDYKDIEGDKRMGMETLPIAIEPKKATKITFFGLSLPLLLVWFLWKGLNLSIIFLTLYVVAGFVRCKFGTDLLKNHSPLVANNILKNFRYILLLEMCAWCFS